MRYDCISSSSSISSFFNLSRTNDVSKYMLHWDEEEFPVLLVLGHQSLSAVRTSESCKGQNGKKKSHSSVFSHHRRTPSTMTEISFFFNVFIYNKPIESFPLSFATFFRFLISFPNSATASNKVQKKKISQHKWQSGATCDWSGTKERKLSGWCSSSGWWSSESSFSFSKPIT